MIFKNKYNKKTVGYASKLIKNELFVHPFWKPIPYKNDIDWYQDPFKNDTWCFYLHSLMPINHLMGAYEQKANPQYLDKAKEILISWMVSNDSIDRKPSKYAWKDHSTANRVVSIIFFWDCYKKSDSYDKDFENTLFSLLHKHGEFLFNDQNYNYRNNHGVYQDRSLMELAVLFPDWEESEKWFNKAKSRLMNYIEKFVSPFGVHKEHSSSYHILMLKLLQGIDEFLIFYDRTIPELSRVIHNMEEFLAYITKPTGRVPMTGDSTADAISFLTPDEVKSEVLLYRLTNGEEGIGPSNERIYKDEGIAIFRNSWLDENSMYLKFLSAFNSLAHKHADDLSFLLSIGETDFFVDSGKYNYQEKDDYRKYFRSTMAHNTITVNRKSFDLKSEQAGKSNIEHFDIQKDYSYIVASHKLYPGIVIKRTLIYFKKQSSILIHDKIVSTKENIYSQIFNIGKDVDVEILSKKNVVLRSKVDSNKVELIQLNPVTEFKSYKGDKDPIAGWQSSQFNKKHPIAQLQFTNRGTTLDYRTILNLESTIGIKYYSANVLKNGTRYLITFNDNSKYFFDILDGQHLQ